MFLYHTIKAAAHATLSSVVFASRKKMEVAAGVLLFFLSVAYARDQGAVPGLSTRFSCNLSRWSEIPFWIVNNTIYDVFIIETMLPFIRYLSNHTALEIPFVRESYDDYTIQCARLNGDGEIELGEPIRLKVGPVSGAGSNSSDAESINKALVIDFQGLLKQIDGVTLTLPTCEDSSPQFEVLGFNLSMSGPIPLKDLSLSFTVSNASTLTIPSNISSRMDVAFRLTTDVPTCPENKDYYYYKFSDCKHLEVRVLNPNVNSTLCFAIPKTPICTSPTFVAGNHGCPVQNSTAGRVVLQNCTRGYSDGMLKPELTESGEVCFSNVNPASVANGSSFHYLCSIDPCMALGNCLLRTMISTSVVTYAGPPNEPSITYNGSFLCFSASYSHEEFPVENSAVEISDITGVSVDFAGTYRTRGPHCFSISSNSIPDLCLPFQISVSATNAIGRSSTMAEFRPEIGGSHSGDICNCYLRRGNSAMRSKTVLGAVWIVLLTVGQWCTYL